MTSTFFVKWRHNFNKFYEKKRNVHRSRTTCDIKTVDLSLESYSIVDLRNKKFLDPRAHNFADVTIFEI